MATHTLPADQTSPALRCDEADRLSHARTLIGIVGLTLAVYWPVVQFGFLNWDDPWYIVNNPLIRSWDFANLYRIVSEPNVKNYAPLTTLSFLIDYTLWGDFAGGYHATNLLLHAVNTVLVYALLWQLTKNRGIAGLTAVLFAVHPVQLESVAWISSRKGLLSATFILASLRFTLRPDSNQSRRGQTSEIGERMGVSDFRPPTSDLRPLTSDLWGLLFLFLALLAKAIAVVVPAVVLTYDLWISRRKLSEAVSRQFFAGLLCAIFLLLTVSAQTTMYGGVRGHMALGKLHILAIDTIVLWRYVGMLIWPGSLCVLYDPATDGIALTATLATLGWAAVVWAAWRMRKEAPYLGWGLFTAFVFLLPVLNLVPITTLMNDRYLYLPAIPLLALFAAAVMKLPEWFSELGRVRSAKLISHYGLAAKAAGEFAGVAIMLLAVTGYTLATHFHLPVWRNSKSLWTHAASHVGHLPVVQYQLADAHYEAGDRDRAVAILQRALKNPDLDVGDRKRFRETLVRWRGEGVTP